LDAFGYVLKLLQSGLGNLAAYLAAHVLLCLVPAFFIAGAMTALIPKESVTRFLGRNAPKYVSYPAAALAGSVLSVCSCTIVPLFAITRSYSTFNQVNISRIGFVEMTFNRVGGAAAPSSAAYPGPETAARRQAASNDAESSEPLMLLPPVSKCPVIEERLTEILQ